MPISQASRSTSHSITVHVLLSDITEFHSVGSLGPSPLVSGKNRIIEVRACSSGNPSESQNIDSAVGIAPPGGNEMTGSQENTSDLSCVSATPSRYLVLTEEQLSGVVNLVMKQVLNETHLSGAYAQLCYNFLSELWATKKSPDDGRVQWIGFREVQLRRCGTEFERYRASETRIAAEQLAIERQKKLEAATTEQETEELQFEFEDQDDKERHRALGLMRFIGELYNRSILSFRMIDDCLCELMMDPMDGDAIERACILFLTIEEKFADDAYAQQGQDRYTDILDDLFEIMLENREAQEQEDSEQHLPQRVTSLLEYVCTMKPCCREAHYRGRHREQTRVMIRLFGQYRPYASISMLRRGGIVELWRISGRMVGRLEGIPDGAHRWRAPAA